MKKIIFLSLVFFVSLGNTHGQKVPTFAMVTDSINACSKMIWGITIDFARKTDLSKTYSELMDLIIKTDSVVYQAEKFFRRVDTLATKYTVKNNKADEANYHNLLIYSEMLFLRLAFEHLRGDLGRESILVLKHMRDTQFPQQPPPIQYMQPQQPPPIQYMQPQQSGPGQGQGFPQFPSGPGRW